MSVDWIYFNQQDANLQNGTAELPEEYEDVLYTDALGKVGTAQFVGSDNASRPVIIPISGKCLLDRANGRTGLVPGNCMGQTAVRRTAKQKRRNERS